MDSELLLRVADRLEEATTMGRPVFSEDGERVNLFMFTRREQLEISGAIRAAVQTP